MRVPRGRARRGVRAALQAQAARAAVAGAAAGRRHAPRHAPQAPLLGGGRDEPGHGQRRDARAPARRGARAAEAAGELNLLRNYFDR